MKMKLDKYFWRSSIYSLTKSECYNREQNCIGGTGEGNDLCDIGYIGANCEACDLDNIRN